MNKNELRTRRVAWEIIKRATSRDRRLSDVTAEIFRIESNNLNDQDRRFITMLVQGTVRMSGRLDWEIRQVFVGEYKALREVFNDYEYKFLSFATDSSQVVIKILG